MSWSENAARWFLRVPRGALRAPPVRVRQPARQFADDPDQRPPAPGRDRDVSPSKVRREAIICPPAIQTTWPYRLPPQIPPPPRRPPPSRPPQPPPRPATRLDFVRTLRVPSRVNKPPPPRSKDDPPVITGLCSLAEATTCPKVPGPGGKAEPPPECAPPSPPVLDCCPPPPPPPPPPKDTCCIPPSQREPPQPLFSCDPPICCSPGPCPPPCPCPPPKPPPLLLRVFSQLFWWGGRVALAMSLVYWTYVYGLWGSSDETKAIVDSWKNAIGYTAKEGGYGFWLRVSKVWDGGVKMLFSALGMALRFLLGPGMGTDPQPQHQTAEIARVPEPDEDDDLAPCGCCKRKPEDQAPGKGELPG